MFELRITPLALVDLKDIWYYTFKEWSFEQADLYQSSIEFCFSKLAENRLMLSNEAISDLI
jgi:plasmid stabilization system protein ParE